MLPDIPNVKVLLALTQSLLAGPRTPTTISCALSFNWRVLVASAELNLAFPPHNLCIHLNITHPVPGLSVSCYSLCLHRVPIANYTQALVQRTEQVPCYCGWNISPQGITLFGGEAEMRKTSHNQSFSSMHLVCYWSTVKPSVMFNDKSHLPSSANLRFHPQHSPKSSNPGHIYPSNHGDKAVINLSLIWGHISPDHCRERGLSCHADIHCP